MACFGQCENLRLSEIFKEKQRLLREVSMIIKKFLSILLLIMFIGVSTPVQGKSYSFNDSNSIYTEKLKEGIKIVEGTIEFISEIKENYHLIRKQVNDLVKDKEIVFMVRCESAQLNDRIYSNVWIIETTTNNYILGTDVYKYYYKIFQSEIDDLTMQNLKNKLFENKIMELKTSVDCFAFDPNVVYISVFDGNKTNYFAIVAPIISYREELFEHFDWRGRKFLIDTEEHCNIISEIYKVFKEAEQKSGNNL